MMKVFRYGALPPGDGTIRAQMKLGRKYYNMLVEAENARRKRVWGDDKCPPPAHEPEIVFDEKGRKKKKFCKCDECREDWRVLRLGYYRWPRLDVIPVREQAVGMGLYWGTYQKIEEAFSAACSKTKFYDLVTFKRWQSGGIVAVHMQNGASQDSQVLIEKAPDPRKGRRAGQRRTVRVRVGTENRAPKWSDPVAIELHRPLQGVVVWAMVCLGYSGEREVWSVNFTCKGVPERTDNALEGAVAIDVGWRAMGDGSLRIAYAKGSDGHEYELALPASWRERSEKADRIQSYRKIRLNKLQKKDMRFARLESANSVARLAQEMGYLEEKEGGGRFSLEKRLGAWIRRERHLHQYETGCRRRSAAARRDAVRVWLRNLRRKYTIAVIKDSKHKEMKDHDTAVDAGMPPQARRNAHHGAPGELIEEICKVFGRNTGVVVIPDPGTTSTCARCGTEMEVGEELLTECERCGAREDRDRVSTRNMLSRYFAGGGEKPTARKQTARFAKRHVKKASSNKTSEMVCESRRRDVGRLPREPALQQDQRDGL